MSGLFQDLYYIIWIAQCLINAQLLLICRGTDEEGQLYGFAVASGKRYVEQRKLFMQYLANTKNNFDEIIGDEASLICNKVYLKTWYTAELCKINCPKRITRGGNFTRPGNISTASCPWNPAALPLTNSVRSLINCCLIRLEQVKNKGLRYELINSSLFFTWRKKLSMCTTQKQSSMCLSKVLCCN